MLVSKTMLIPGVAVDALVTYTGLSFAELGTLLDSFDFDPDCYMVDRLVRTAQGGWTMKVSLIK